MGGGRGSGGGGRGADSLLTYPLSATCHKLIKMSTGWLMILAIFMFIQVPGISVKRCTYGNKSGYERKVTKVGTKGPS